MCVYIYIHILICITYSRSDNNNKKLYVICCICSTYWSMERPCQGPSGKRGKAVKREALPAPLEDSARGVGRQGQRKDAQQCLPAGLSTLTRSSEGETQKSKEKDRRIESTLESSCGTDDHTGWPGRLLPSCARHLGQARPRRPPPPEKDNHTYF